MTKEWEEAYREKLAKVESIPEEDFFRAIDVRWADGMPITLWSLFTYEYKGAGHEGGHAMQIGERFENGLGFLIDIQKLTL